MLKISLREYKENLQGKKFVKLGNYYQRLDNLSSKLESLKIDNIDSEDYIKIETIKSNSIITSDQVYEYFEAGESYYIQTCKDKTYLIHCYSENNQSVKLLV